MNPYDVSTIAARALPAAVPPARVSAFFGAFAFPGLGHVLIGRTTRAAIWAIVEISLEVASLVAIVAGAIVQASAGLLAGAIIARFAAAVDAAYCGKQPRWIFYGPGLRTVSVFAGFGLRWILNLGVAIALRATMIEAFVIPTNSMMPALVGRSVWGRCTSCGEETPLSASEMTNDGSSVPFFDDGRPVGICTHCGAQLDGRTFPAPPLRFRSHDRVVVNKWLTPRRWDIMVFRFPEDPRTPYAFRVVGFPGERVEIRDGELTINGEVVEKPTHLQYLHYVSDMGFGPVGWGCEGNAVTVGADEYFVLGDFSARSKDSRLWQNGALGHPPYAVPEDHIIGVVTHIYWPSERWRKFERAEAE